MRSRLVVGIVGLAVLAAGCSGSTEEDGASATTATTVEVPGSTTPVDTATTSTPTSTTEAGIPIPPDAEPGEVLEETALDIDGMRAFRITYVATGGAGDLVPVTGLVFAPPEPPSMQLRNVVSFAHGTTGVADVCAPSNTAVDELAIAARDLVDDGLIVVATDYEGLGTPGVHPYLHGPSAGRSVIDIVRAAQRMNVGASRRWIAWGSSQGGHAALWAGQLAGSYGDELLLEGVVAVAPASGASSVGPEIDTDNRVFVLMAYYAAARIDPRVALEDYFTPTAISALGIIDEACTGDIARVFADWSLEELLVADAFDDRLNPEGALLDVLLESDPGGGIDAPVLIVQGSDDPVVAPWRSEVLAQRYCVGGVRAELLMEPGADHGSVNLTSFGAVRDWIDERFERVPVTGGCNVESGAESDGGAGGTETGTDTTGSVARGVLLAGQQPDGYTDLVDSSSGSRAEICDGVATFGEAQPVEIRGAVWARNSTIGPFLDVFEARFDSNTDAVAALESLESGLLACGEFRDRVTTAEGSFTLGVDPRLGDQSFGVTYAGEVAGIPVDRHGLYVRVGATIYSASHSAVLAEAERSLAEQAIATMTSGR